MFAAATVCSGAICVSEEATDSTVTKMASIQPLSGIRVLTGTPPMISAIAMFPSVSPLQCSKPDPTGFCSISYNSRRSCLEPAYAAAYRSFEQQLIDDLQPNGSCELELIERLAATYWRLRRIPRFEAALMAWREHRDFYYDNRRTPGGYPSYLPLPGEEASPEEEFLDKQTALRWSGRDAY